MSEDEAAKLINTTAQRLDILQLLTERYRADLYDEADGHPYIIKMLLGEVAKRKKIDNIERIVAGKNEILDDLFERTYARLQPVAKRVFLTLCSWRSLVPQLALEAVLLRPTNEKMDVGAAIEELVQSSFIERVVAADGTIFFDVALVATVFGRKKLDVSGMRPAIQADVEFLQQIGATSASTLRFGLGPRISRLFQSIASRLSDNRVELDAVLPSLEFICRQYAAAWLLLAELHEESGLVGGIGKAAECLRRFLEQSNEPPEQQKGWSELARLCTIMGDWMGAAQAQIEICKFPNTEFSLVIQQIG